MKSSSQDRTYLESEANNFFGRCDRDADPAELRPYKRDIVERLDSAGVSPQRMLEYGCNYGDMLGFYARERGVEAYGVEPSSRAVELGQQTYGDLVNLRVGTIADNTLNDDPEMVGKFDLVVVDDVFCWVSRETVFQSVANIDSSLRDGGFLYIREFLPLHQGRNPNHHVASGDVFCYKPSGPHLGMFTASGVYEIVWQHIDFDRADPFLEGDGRSAFESRWSTVVLRKSLSDYFA